MRTWRLRCYRGLRGVDLLVILVLIAGGAGLLPSSLRTLPPRRRA
jgi:hypothetical protein